LILPINLAGVLPVNSDVIVIGAGIVGLSSAYYLIRAGLTVTVIDEGQPASARCSSGNAGMIVPSHFVPLAAPGMVEYGLRMLSDKQSPFGVKIRADHRLVDWGLKFMRSCTPAHVDSCVHILRDLNLRSRELYIALDDDLEGGFDLTLRGLTMFCKTNESLHHEYAFADKAVALGVPATKLDKAQVQALDPSLELDVAGGVYFPKDAHLSPDKLLHRLQTYLVSKGVTFHWNARADSLKPASSSVDVSVGTSRMSAGKVVIAGGTWSPHLTETLGVRMPMQGGKGYSFILDNPIQLPERCSILVEARVAVTPMGGRLLIGGTMEIAGDDLSVNQNRVSGIRKSVQEYFPAYRDKLDNLTPVWSGLRPCSPDGLPYIGELKSDNVVVATGHSMMGLSLGPVTGEVVTDIVTGSKPKFDIQQLRPERWG
jgi:D-amino-acid dehydrogenase